MTPIRHSSSGVSHSRRASRSGMALVITLIMLSVTLIMAIAFLAISRRERISVGSSTDGTVARFATDTGLAAAESQIIANIYSTTNAAFYDYNLLVSTNYINPFGYVIGSQSPTNVNYDYRSDGVGLNGADFDQNVANLQILPRAPVLISATDTNGRFYLDLNRNGKFEDTGVLPFSVGIDGTVFNTPFPNAIGDPQWIGVLERPGLPHSADNKFTSRYCFIALPIGESLDINAIHNQVFDENLGSPGTMAYNIHDPYYRNQGVGSWEINLAAFLADLNTNQWGQVIGNPVNGNTTYYYYQYLFPENRGWAFLDAQRLLDYRYNNTYTSLAAAGNLFGWKPLIAAGVLPFDNIDLYSDGPEQFATTNIMESLLRDDVTLPWAGADNANRFYTPSDFFDRSKTQFGVPGGVFGFTDRLNNAGTNTYNSPQSTIPTYDRYTFYRMLDQLGTDSLPDSAGKLNLNWKNAIVTYNPDPASDIYVSTTIVPDMETNLYEWTPRDFFCAAADQMLKVYTTNWFQAGPSNYLVTYFGTNYAIPIDSYTGFGLTNVPYFGVTNQVPAFGLANIPVSVNGNFVYSPAVNRVLQLAANIFDAGTNDFYPHVFRPTFWVTNEWSGRNVYINGYQEVSSLTGFTPPTTTSLGLPPLDQPVDLSFLPFGVTSGLGNKFGNVYGIPWIVGAKKFMPNFNEFYAFNTAQVTRKLQFNRTQAPIAWSGTDEAKYTTNQMLNLSITNHIGFSFWNSYAANYPGLPYVYAQDYITMRLSYGSFSYTYSTNFIWARTPSPWIGSGWDTSVQPRKFNNGNSFWAGAFEFPFVHEASLDLDQNGNPQGTGFKTETFVGAPTTLPPFPAYEEDTTNRFQAVILDNGHVLDYVQFYGPVSVRNLGDDISDPNSGSYDHYMWSTNGTGLGSPATGVNWGVQHQIEVSESGQNLPPGAWVDPPNMPAGLQGNKPAEAAMFKGFFLASWTYSGTPTKTYYNTNLVQQAPYTPTRTVVSPTLWIVNDPLVHNLSSDLTQPVPESSAVTNGVAKSDDPSVPPVPIPNLSQPPDRYQPWGMNAQMNGVVGVLRDDYGNASYNLAYRDPLVWGSDNWDFPTNRYPTVGWLGRVHRGTPWQTVYLKSTNLLDFVDSAQADSRVGLVTWKTWTGDFNEFDADKSKPIQDELLFDIFTAAPNANASRGALSVNQKHPAAWSAVLGGLEVITNITSTPDYRFPPVYGNVLADPAGVDLVDSPVWQIVNNGVNGINAIRAGMYPGGFPHAGDILRVPLLSDQSPFLNQSDSSRTEFDLSDEAYERLPEQIMGLVRSPVAPRYVIYTYGQTLKPAPDGTVLSGQFFGLVTNYQVVAESATRAVISVQPVVTNGVMNQLINGSYVPVTGPATNYNIKVESFNVLPPD
ncbi:MAG: pilus assembly PilX N-terminal domain-containing protein [Verrucomicrobiae bacterium]|nr:pilus assembly PilX N-terminal domain-containing protein [Verrucomicrobiae bacterium]